MIASLAMREDTTMREPSVSWRQREAKDDADVLVLKFDVGVELRIAGELGLRMAHWESRPEFDPEVQREEVARAIEWGRLHDAELRARFHRHLSGFFNGDRGPGPE